MKQINSFKYQNVFDAFTLKIIAVVAMVIDHVGLLFFPEVDVYRLIGRLALPIFAFLLTEGLLKTRSVKNYLVRLIVFAIISQIPYSLMSYVSGNDVFSLNIFFLLALGLGALALVRRQKNIYLKVLIIIVACLISQFSGTDYGTYGILIIVSCYIMRRSQNWGVLMFIVVNIINSIVMGLPLGLIQFVSVSSLPLITRYNGKPGIKVNKWLFYWFYPAHMLILVVIYSALQ